MSNNGLDVPPPPKKSTPASAKPANDAPKPAKKRAGQGARPKNAPTKFDKVAESEKVQFNKRIKRGTADGFEMLAITSRRKVPELLDEALEMLKEKYGQV